jgi:hypothetical protein
MNHERQWEQRQRRWAWSAAWVAKMARGEETPSEPESLRGDDEEVKDEEEGEVTPPEYLPSLGGLFSQQTGISTGACQPKCPRTGTGASSGPPPQSGLVLVSFDLQGMNVVLVVMGIAHLLGVL